MIILIALRGQYESVLIKVVRENRSVFNLFLNVLKLHFLFLAASEAAHHSLVFITHFKKLKKNILLLSPRFNLAFVSNWGNK